jgi:hypothetical protein
LVLIPFFLNKNNFLWEAVHYYVTHVVNLSAAPFPNAIRSTASILDLLSGSRAASPVDKSAGGCTGDMTAASSISTACALSREAKASSLQPLKDENVDRNKIFSQHYKGKRLVIYCQIFSYK